MGNLHKYKALPGESSLLEQAQAAAQKLRSLPKIFSEALKGVKLGLAVAKEIEAWTAFAGPVFRATELPKKPESGSRADRGPVDEDLADPLLSMEEGMVDLAG